MSSPRLLPGNTSSRFWRVLSLSSALREAWLVERLRFFEDDLCSVQLAAGNASASGWAPHQGPENALAGSPTFWNSSCGTFCCGSWIGVEFSEPHEVRCVLVDLPANSSAKPPLSLQVQTGGEWLNVATVPPDGGVADSWGPVALGAVCQGIAVLGPEFRGGGSLWALYPHALSRERMKLKELRFYADSDCSEDVTPIGVPWEGFIWGKSWQPGHVPVVSTAFDRNESTIWTAAMWQAAWLGANSDDIPVLGMMLPDNVNVKCLNFDQAGFAHRYRLVRCHGPAQWVGTDNCRCQSSWGRPAVGDMLVEPPRQRLLPVLIVLLLLGALLFAASQAAKLEALQRSLVEALFGQLRRLRRPRSRQPEVSQPALSGRSDSDAVPLIAGGSEDAGQATGGASIILTGDLPHCTPIHKLFKQQARHHHHHHHVHTGSEKSLCLRSSCGELTFRQVAELVDAVVEDLRRCLQPQSVVGLILGRGPCYVVAVFAVMEAECVWVPMDDRAPNERVKNMLEDAGASLVLVDEGASWDLGIACAPMSLDGRLLSSPTPQKHPLPFAPEADIACFYYTSGSTGAPKAVIFDHQFLALNVQWYIDYTKVTPKSVVTSKARFIWGTSVWEVLPSLTCGAAMLMLPQLKTEEVPRALALGGATHMCGVPSELELIVTPELKLQNIICIGERLHPGTAERIYQRLPRGCVMMNAYAATESASTLWRYTPGSRSIFAGRPLQGSSVAVIAADGTPAPMGEIGEVVMGGAYPRYGYWRRPEITAERFGDSVVGYACRTGDMGRIVADDSGELQLEITGRKDRQVKIRGQRVELGEVEACAAEVVSGMGNVAVVAASTEDGQQHMFLFGAPSHVLDTYDIRCGMEKKLPKYMVPDAHRIRLLPELPRLANGKVNFLELKSSAETMLAGEEHTALDSLGLARKYSQEQLAVKHAVDTASGWFLLGMLLFHGRWWNYGSTPLGCVDCTPPYIIKFLYAVVVNEICLFGFVCGAALMSSTQADCFVFTSRDTVTLIVYFFMYCPWNFILDFLSPHMPWLFFETHVGSMQYGRWYLVMVLAAKALLILTKRTGLWPSLVVLALLGAIVVFPEEGLISVPIEGTCGHPGSVLSFLLCLCFPFTNKVILMERKFISPTMIYFISVVYGPPFARCCGRIFKRPAGNALRAASGAAFFALATLVGYWYVNLLYPAAGFETVEWPDGLDLVANPRIDNKRAVIMLALGIGVPVVQVVLIFAAVYFAPGDGVKRVVSSWVQSTLLGTYLLTVNLNFRTWVLQAVMFVCDCQCNAVQGVAQLVAVFLVLLVTSFTFGSLFQAFLLKAMVPAVWWAWAKARDLMEAALDRGESSTSDSEESCSTE